ncbi:MAG: cytochrome C oxidase subunit IV family protein [Sedimenticola sp.]
MDRKNTLGIRPCTWVYILLMGFTLVTFMVGQMEFSGLTVSLLVLLLALIKGQLVGAYFMGLGRLRGLWRWPVFIWLFIPGILISTAFYLST